MSQRVAGVLLIASMVTACGPRPWSARLPPQRLHAPPVPARVVYRGMGLMVDTSRLPFVASVRFLAGATPDSTLAVFAMSLANRALDFRPEGHDFVAGYHVELALRAAGGVARESRQDELVRVHRLSETQRYSSRRIRAGA